CCISRICCTARGRPTGNGWPARRRGCPAGERCASPWPTCCGPVTGEHASPPWRTPPNSSPQCSGRRACRPPIPRRRASSTAPMWGCGTCPNSCSRWCRTSRWPPCRRGPAPPSRSATTSPYWSTPTPGAAWWAAEGPRDSSLSAGAAAGEHHLQRRDDQCTEDAQQLLLLRRRGPQRKHQHELVGGADHRVLPQRLGDHGGLIQDHLAEHRLVTADLPAMVLI